jgi:hypothetical protein
MPSTDECSPVTGVDVLAVSTSLTTGRSPMRARSCGRVGLRRGRGSHCLDWQVLRFTWLDLVEYPQRVIAEIRFATGAR